MKEYYFIAGLPRSGSTMLSAILKQNPLFHADVLSPLAQITASTVDYMTVSHNNVELTTDRRTTLLQYIFEGYYNCISKPIIFDTSRVWTSKTGLLKQVFPYTKIICCIRDIRWILDSFERLFVKNSLYKNTMIDPRYIGTVHNRCDFFMDPNANGHLYGACLWITEGLALNPDMIHLLEYDELCKNPEKSMKEIYKFLDKQYYAHDFDNLEYSNDTYDQALNLKDMHTVRKKVEYIERKTILPDGIWSKYQNIEFTK